MAPTSTGSARSCAGRFRPQLQRQLVHPSDDVLDRSEHVALEVRIVAVPLRIGKKQLKLCDQVLEVVDDKRRHAMEGVEFLRLEQGLRGLRVRKVAGGLATGRLQQIQDFPVQFDLHARSRQHDEAHEVLRRQQRNDDPGIPGVRDAAGKREVS
jgi:hypothetical protein